MWEDVAFYRYKELVSEVLLNLFNDGTLIQGCVDCPCLKVNVNGNYVTTRCIVTKCIKQYPHISDNEEFR